MRGRRVGAWLGTSLLAAFVITAATAEAQDSTRRRVRLAQAEAGALRFDIAAQPLDRALAAWAARSGRQVVAPGEVTAGITSSPVQGNLTADAALRQMLAGTGVVADPQPGGSVALRRVAQGSGDGAIVLDPVTVEAARPAPPTATIGTLPPAYAGGQVARGGRVGLLGNRDYMDTPYNTASFTEETIKDAQARRLSDVLRRDPSVIKSEQDLGSTDGRFFIRGFITSIDAIGVDGLYGLAPQRSPILEAVERIEVIKGPSALLTGFLPGGDVGGAINLVTKRAGDRPAYELTVGYESDLLFRGLADLGGRFGPDKAFGVRANVAYEAGERSLDENTLERPFGSLALDYRGDRLRLALTGLSVRRDVEGLVDPFPVAAGAQIPAAPDGDDRYEPESSKFNDRASLVSGRLEYDLFENLTVGLAHGESVTDNRWREYVFTLTGADGDGNFVQSPFESNIRSRASEANLRWDIATGPISHALSLSALRFKSRSIFRFDSSAPFPSNLFDPTDGPAFDLFFNNPDSINEAENTSFGLADTVGIFDDRLQVTLGLRRQRVEADSGSRGGPTTSFDDTEYTPTVGALLRITPEVSVYGNYIEALSQGPTAPTTGVVNPNETFPPIESEQYEAGVKLDLGTVGATLAAFQIKRPAGIVTATDDPLLGQFDVDGEERNRGLELTLFGEYQGVRLLGGLALNDPELTETADGANDGNDSPGVPRWVGTLGAEWDVPMAPGLTLAGGVQVQRGVAVDAENEQKTKGFAVFDLGARYTFDLPNPITVRASVENLTDASYYAGSSFNRLTVGAPRTFLVSTSIRF